MIKKHFELGQTYNGLTVINRIGISRIRFQDKEGRFITHKCFLDASGVETAIMDDRIKAN